MDTRHTTGTSLVLRFGTFEFRPARMLLLEQGKAVRLGNRALDILRILIERAGEVVTKEELIEYTWPTTVVEEGNLRVHIGALRRVLRDGDGGGRYIVNVIGRGYSFVAEVRREEEGEADASPGTSPGEQNDLPAPLTRMLGRSQDVTALVELLRSSRLVTVVGPGGVGKSTLALEVASNLVDSHRERARFVDLAAIGDPALVPQSCATAIGMVVPAANPVAGLVAFLRDKQMLLLLDNCEHVIDAAAAVTEAILKGAPAMRVLATSREPLRIQGERQHRLHPLHVPPVDESITAANARQYPAVELFAERASTSVARAFELTDANAHWIASVCRRLDGIPLAIELAAARVGLLGARDLLARLDEQLFLFATGRRTATARHQTLRAALDWSYSLLSVEEQVVLRRLSVFSAAFTLDSAVAVAARGELSDAQVVDAMMSLAEKSLLTADTGDPDVRYRLLQTTQSYAQEKLAGTDDHAHIFRWHAEYVLQLLRRGESDWERMTRTEWVRAYDHAVDDVRAALQWAFATPGDLDFAAELTLAAVPFAFQMALTEEIRDRLASVLQRIIALAVRQPALEARVNQALDALNNNMEAARRARTNTGTRRVDASHGHLRDQLGSLVQLTIIQIEDGEYGTAVESAGRLGEVARAAGEPSAALVADRVMAQAQHFHGNHASARALAERVITHPARSVPLSYLSVQVDLRVSMRIVLARIHWISGYPDLAMEIVEEALQYAASDTPFAICQTLALAACPVAFWRGDYPALARFVPRLIEQAERFRLGNWHTYGECYARLVAGRRDAALRASPGRLQGPASHVHKAEIVRLASDKRLLRQTVATADSELMGCTVIEPERSSDSTEGWCAPELLRIRGVHLLATQPQLESRAEGLLQQSLELARSQGAASWALRTAMSLSSLYGRQGRGHEARATLSAALERIVAGETTRDVLTARAQLAKH